MGFLEKLKPIFKIIGEKWQVLIFIIILSILGARMSSKSSSLDIDTVNRKLQEIPPITTVGGSQIQFNSIFPDS